VLKNKELFIAVQSRTPVYFVDELNLSKYVTTKAMLQTKSKIDLKSIPPEMMNYNAFVEWHEKEEFRKQDVNDRSKRVWPKESDEVLEDYKLLKLLGRGGFGKVVLVENQKDKKMYAMKILKKKDIMDQDQVTHTKAEKDILQHVNHPCLVSLHSAFSNKRKIYFILELMRGGELYCHLGKVKRFTEPQTKFIIACIVLALGHLHKHNYIYRDLKLENILLNDKGYAKLTDFGLAKFVRREDRTQTICGTIFYLAPEVLSADEGHSHPADWWSLGILTYELLNGFPPFYSKNDKLLMKMIKSGEFNFYDKVPLTKECKDFITKLLLKKQSQRLGSSKDMEEVKAHPWFNGFDWKALENMTAVAPYDPHVTDANWIHNFDEEFLNQDVRDSAVYEMEKDNQAEIDDAFKGFED
jgi:serum/glucocorticoid-regulated kinase 2